MSNRIQSWNRRWEIVNNVGNTATAAVSRVVRSAARRRKSCHFSLIAVTTRGTRAGRIVTTRTWFARAPSASCSTRRTYLRICHFMRSGPSRGSRGRWKSISNEPRAKRERPKSQERKMSRPRTRLQAKVKERLTIWTGRINLRNIRNLQPRSACSTTASRCRRTWPWCATSSRSFTKLSSSSLAKRDRNSTSIIIWWNANNLKKLRAILGSWRRRMPWRHVTLPLRRRAASRTQQIQRRSQSASRTLQTSWQTCSGPSR